MKRDHARPPDLAGETGKRRQRGWSRLIHAGLQRLATALFAGVQRLFTALFRLLLLTHPRARRRRYGGEILQTFVERSAAARRRGTAALIALSCRELAGLATSGIRARRAAPPVTTATARPHPPLSPRKTEASIMDTFLQDVRYSLRALARSPGFSAIAAIALALGIGANTAIFSVVDAVVFRPLPFPEPERLVAIWEKNPERDWYEAQVAAANFLDWREQATSFVGMAAHNDWLEELPMNIDGEPEMVFANEVTGDLFDVLGVEPMLGEGFTPAHDWSVAQPVVVLNHRFWRSRFAADREIIGRQVVLGGVSRTIVGVMTPGFTYPYVFPAGLSGLPEIDLWIPMGWSPEFRNEVWFRRAHGMSVVGRLQPDVSFEAAEAELAAIAGRLEELYPETNRLMGNGLTPLHAWIVGDHELPLLLMLAAVGFVLLIACANVANLLLTRATARRDEMAVRAALGAGRARLIRQGLTESLMLSLIGGGLGVVGGSWSIGLLLSLRPEGLPRVDSIGLDARMLAFAAALMLSTGLVFGLVPAWRGSRPHGDTSLGNAGRGSSAARSSRRANRILVAAEVALALPLVVGAGLMARTLWQLQQVDPGFDTTNTLVAQLALPEASYATETDVAAFYDRLTTALRGIPGVEAAALDSRMPFRNQRWSSDFTVEGWPQGRYGQGVRHGEITPGYFATARIPLLAGRDFDRADNLDSSPFVVIINKTLADTYFAGEDPVGKMVTFNSVPDENSTWRQIVGVVGDIKRESLASEPLAEFYAPVLQDITRGVFLLTRTRDEPLGMVDAVRAQVRALDADLPVFGLTTFAAIRSSAMANERFLLSLFGAFAAVSLLLAAVGVYGVISYSITQRAREIGIRMALGARHREVARLVIAGGMGPVGVGIAAGLVISVLLARVMTTLVYGVTPFDPLTFGAVVLILGAVALLACLVPARRAIRIDAVIALRGE